MDVENFGLFPISNHTVFKISETMLSVYQPLERG